MLLLLELVLGLQISGTQMKLAMHLCSNNKLILQSTKHPEAPENQGSCLRVDLTVCFVCDTTIEPPYTLETASREHLTTKITYCSVVNPGGWAPASVLRAVYKREYPRFLKRFTQYVDIKCKSKPIFWWKGILDGRASFRRLTLQWLFYLKSNYSLSSTSILKNLSDWKRYVCTPPILILSLQFFLFEKFSKWFELYQVFASLLKKFIPNSLLRPTLIIYLHVRLLVLYIKSLFKSIELSTLKRFELLMLIPPKCKTFYIKRTTI